MFKLPQNLHNSFYNLLRLTSDGCTCTTTLQHQLTPKRLFIVNYTTKRTRPVKLKTAADVMRSNLATGACS